jgi:hypothetical protein
LYWAQAAQAAGMWRKCPAGFRLRSPHAVGIQARAV